jgi:hypothetical protein
MFAVTLALILFRQGKLLEVFFPMASLLTGAWLYRRAPVHYVAFLCWLFFLTPEVRRFADFYNGSFNPTSFIQTAPLIVASLSAFGMLRHYRTLGQRCAAPLLVIALGITYAYLIGAVRNGPLPATFTLVAWVLPVLIGFHIVQTWQLYPVYQRVMVRTFVWGTLLMGVYGVVQFVFMPPWDAFWLLGSGMASEGDPVPFGMRVCSTMNSSGPFAVTMMVGLLIAVGAQGVGRLGAGIAGFPALVLTSVRSAWGGTLLGLVYPLYSLTSRGRFKLLGTAAVLAALCVPLGMMDAVSDRIGTRLQTIGNLSNDSSFQAREDLYTKFFANAFTDIAGQGLGAMGVGAKLSDGDDSGVVSFDSGLMEVPITLGWPGTLLYGVGLATLLWRAIKLGRVLRHDRFAAASIGIALALFSMMVFANMLTSSTGLFFYMGVLFPAIAARHARAMRDNDVQKNQARHGGIHATAGGG